MHIADYSYIACFEMFFAVVSFYSLMEEENKNSYNVRREQQNKHTN